MAIYEEPPRFDRDLANAEGDDMDEWVDKLREVLRYMPTSQQHLLDVPLPLWTRIVLAQTPNSLPLAVGEWVDDFDIFAAEKKRKCLACGDDERCESIWEDEIKFCRKCFFAGSDRCSSGIGRACTLPANLVGLVGHEEGLPLKKKKAMKKTRSSVIQPVEEEPLEEEMDETVEVDDSPKKKKKKRGSSRKSIAAEHVEEEPMEDADIEEAAGVDDCVKQQVCFL